MDKNARIYIAGHTGLVGSAIVRKLKNAGYNGLILKEHKELDLTSQAETEDFFNKEKPDYVIAAAGLVGGIKANSEAPADFYAVNMAIANNIILSAHKVGVKKLLYLGSACQYPTECEQPMKEEMLLSGTPEVTNEGYALTKICGCRLCKYLKTQYGDNFISAIPANAYGLGDCFDPQKSHVIPAMIMKYHNAKVAGLPSVDLWGTGKALREFLFTEDLADGCLFLMENYDGIDEINMGSGSELSIWELSQMISKVVGYEGETVCDPSKPDGMMRRMLDSSKINSIGWKAKTSMEDGLKQVYEEYKERHCK